MADLLGRFFSQHDHWAVYFQTCVGGKGADFDLRGTAQPSPDPIMCPPDNLREPFSDPEENWSSGEELVADSNTTGITGNCTPPT